MAWEKFAHLSNRLEGKEPGIKYSAASTRRQDLPIEESKRADMLFFLERISIGNDDSEPASETPDEVKRYMRVELSRKRKGRPATDDWLPRWARDIVDRQGSQEEVIQVAFDKMVREPSEKTFLEAEIVINELGRSKEGTALFMKYLTPDFLKKLTRVMNS